MATGTITSFGNAVSTRALVLFAIPALDRDGPARVMFELLSALDRARYAPVLLTTVRGGRYFERLPKDIPVTVLEHYSVPARRYPWLDTLAVVRRLAPNIVFTTLRMNLTLGLTRCAFPKRTRLVIRQANDFSTDFERLVRTSIIKHRVAKRLTIAALRNADAIVCQSDWMRGDLATALGSDKRLTTIFNPIDVAQVQRTADALSPHVPGHPSVVSVGRLTAQKGYDLLLDAIALLRHRYPGIHVTVFGEGSDHRQLVARRSRLGIDAHVSFVGFCEDVLAHVRRADLFVLSSRYEGFPNAALEALACGTPVVLTNCPGANAEIVRPSFNGELARDSEPRAIAEALERAIRALPAYNRTKIAADTDDRFGARHIVSQYEKLFTSVAEGH